MPNDIALRIAICGGGASAVLLVTALRERATRKLDITIIEPRAQLGLGVAYATDCPLHLLNTRAGNMSAGSAPDDFLQWLRIERPRRVMNWTRNDFAPRRLYGEYLQARLKDATGASHIRFRWLQSMADSIIAHGSEWEVVPAQGNSIKADIVVLATGNEAPRAVPASAAPPARRFIFDNPWNAAPKAQITAEAGVLLVGTGLTAVDMVVELLHRGHTGPIYAVSRRGLLPRAHGPTTPMPDGLGAALPQGLRDLVRRVRELTANDPRGGKWQTVVNELRPIASTLWARWSLSERRRFLRHVRPFWDVHRHRIAPQVNARLTRAIKCGQLKILRGRIQNIETHAHQDKLRINLRQPDGVRTLEVAHIINCTGPETDPRRALNPLLQSLVSDSLARPDLLGLGLAVDSQSRVIGADGSAHRTLFALGPLTCGSRWEAIAVAEIRDQATALARHLAHNLIGAPDCAAALGSLGDYRHVAA